MRPVHHILRSAVGLLFAVFVLELCARLDDYISYGASLWAPYNNQILYVQDKLGKKGKPGARYKKWQLNSLGFRGPELQPGRVRIICTGVSETFGLYEGPNQEYPRQLEKELNARAGRDLFQVVNVAYPGEKLLLDILRVPEIVEMVRPQIAVIYLNPAPYVWLPWVKPAPAAPAATVSRPRFEWRIADNLRELAKRLLPESVQNYLLKREISHEVELYGTVIDRVPEKNIVRFRNDVEKLVNALRRAGVEPVLVTHATRFGPVLSVSSPGERHVLLTWRKFFPVLKEGAFLDMEWRANEAMRQLAAEQHLMLIDAAREIPPGKLNFADYCHFTTGGAHLMAVHLADGLAPLLRCYAGEQLALTGDANLGYYGKYQISTGGETRLGLPAGLTANRAKLLQPMPTGATKVVQ